MSEPFDPFEQFRKAQFDGSLTAFSAISKGFQDISTEAAAYSKRSLEDRAAALEKLISARTPDQVVQIQTEYVTSALESLAAESARVRDIFAELYENLVKPYQAMMTDTVQPQKTNGKKPV